MSDIAKEQQLVGEARIALLEAIVSAAEVGNGDQTKALVEAYDVLAAARVPSGDSGPSKRLNALRERR